MNNPNTIQKKDLLVPAPATMEDLSSENDASLEELLDSLRESYKKAVNKINHQEICCKKSIAEIPLLKLDASQSIKREEDIKKQFLQAKLEFTEYRQKCIDRVQGVAKFSYEILPQWLKDKLQSEDQTKTKVVVESDQVSILHQVNRPTDSKDDQEAFPKIHVDLNNVPDDELLEDVNESDGHLNEGTSKDLKNVNPGDKRKLAVKTTSQKRSRTAKASTVKLT